MPAKSLSGLNGTNLNGIWTLQLTGSSAGSTGTLLSWSLIATPVVPTEPAPPATPLPAQAEGALFVRDSSNGSGLWYAQPSSPSDVPLWFTNGQALGTATDIPLQGDFDGDGKTDLATYNPATAVWTIASLTSGAQTPIQFGAPGDIPVPGDFNGPGATELGVYNPATAVWTSGAQTPIQFGAPGDIPVPGDYDGVGHDELAVYRPSTGQFFVYEGASKLGEIITITGLTPNASLVPVPAEYNNALGLPYKTEAAVFNPSTGTYTIAGPTGVYTVTFQAGDIPVPADYAGTGSIQPAVYRPSTEQFLEKNSAGTNTVIAMFPALSTATVVPVDAPLSYRIYNSAKLDPPTPTPTPMPMPTPT